MQKGICWSSAVSVGISNALMAKRSNDTLECTKHDQLVKRGDYPSSALLQSYHECCLQFWVPQFKEDVKVLECAQRNARN